jgi:ABC-type glycerol-3-phosphate transport system substrate-binding protein
MKSLKVRSILAICTALSILMTMTLTGCASKTKSTSNTGNTAKTGEAKSEPVVLDFTYWEGSPADKQGFDSLISKFENENPNIKINKQVLPSGAKYYESLDTRIAGKQYPSIARLQYQKLGRYIDANVLLDMTSRIDKANQDDLLPAFKSAVSVKDKLYAMPHHTDTMAIFYNKDMFEKAGIQPPTSIDKAWTWDEFLDVSRKIKEKTGVKYAFTYKWTKNTGYRALPFLYMNGGSILNADGTKAAINTPQGIEFLNYIKTWSSEGLISKTSPNSSDSPDELFVTGVVAMEIAGNYIMSYIDENMKDKKWGVTYMPQKNGKTGADMGGNALAVFAQSKYPEESAKFVKFMTDAENSKAFCEVTNFLPVRKSIPKENMKFAAYNNEMKLFLDQVATVDPNMAAVETNKKFQPIMQVISDNIEKIILNGASGEQVVKDMEKGINDAIKD